MDTLAAYAAFGANLGEPAATLDRAARRMDGLCPGVRLAARSRIWHTAPHDMEEMEYPLPECLRSVGKKAGLTASPWYANMAVKLDCPANLTPEQLFEALMRLEAELGRNRVMERRFGPRFIDIDLVAFGNAVMDTARLILPHPRALERPFVLLPLREIAPDFVPSETLDRLSFFSSGTIIF